MGDMGTDTHTDAHRQTTKVKTMVWQTPSGCFKKLRFYYAIYFVACPCTHILSKVAQKCPITPITFYLDNILIIDGIKVFGTILHVQPTDASFMIDPLFKLSSISIWILVGVK